MFSELSPDWQEEASLGKESQAEGQQMQRPCNRDLHAMCQQWKDGRWAECLQRRRTGNVPGEDWRSSSLMFIAKWHNLKCSDSQHSSDAQTSFVLSYLFTYFIIGYTGSSLLCVGFLFAEWRLLSNFSAWASHCKDFSCCGAQALGRGLRELWHMALVASQQVESSQTREPMSPALGGGFFNHWATRETLHLFFEEFDYSMFGRSLTHSLKIEFLFSIFFIWKTSKLQLISLE